MFRGWEISVPPTRKRPRGQQIPKRAVHSELVFLMPHSSGHPLISASHIKIHVELCIISTPFSRELLPKSDDAEMNEILLCNGQKSRYAVALFVTGFRTLIGSISMMKDVSWWPLYRSENRKRLTPVYDWHLHGHWIALNNDRRILSANIKWMTSHEANYASHRCLIAGLHQAVGPIKHSDPTRWQGS